jgi:hypothetical protein
VYLDVPGCIWPESETMVWVLKIQDNFSIVPQYINSAKNISLGFFGTNSGEF